MATSWAFSFSTYPTTFFFLLNTHFLPMGFLPSSSVTRSQVSFLLNASISSSMAFFQSSPSIKSIASLTIIGSSSVADNAKIEQKLGGLYLLDYFLAKLDLLITGVCGSTSSYNLVNPFESWLSLFQLNSSFSNSFSLITSSFLEVLMSCLKITSLL